MAFSERELLARLIQCEAGGEGERYTNDKKQGNTPLITFLLKQLSCKVKNKIDLLLLLIYDSV